MIDYDLFDIILNKKDESFITKDDILDLDFFINMSKYPASKVMKLFVKNYEPNTLFKVSLKCKECGDVKALGIPKSKIYEILRDKKHNSYECDICAQTKLEKKEKEYKEKMKFSKEINTKRFIDLFLNPNKSWNKLSSSEKMRELRFMISLTNMQDIKNYILKMKYKDFINTPYWSAISESVKKNAGFRCMICNSNKNLNTHHRTYETHGSELFNMKDLVCICKECHEKHHNIKR